MKVSVKMKQYSSSVSSKNKQLSFYELLKEQTRKFCSSTSIHGFGFITLKYITVSERFLWTFLSFGALALGITLCYATWHYDYGHTTQTFIDTMDHPISQFLFPAITICNLNKVSKSKALAFARDRLQVDNATVWHTKLHLLAQVFFANYEILHSHDYEEIQELLDKKGITVEEALLAVTPRYMAERYKNYPRRIASCGKKSGMNVILSHEPHDYLISEISAYGAKVLIHNTYVYPDWSVHRILVPMLNHVYVAINPSKTAPSDNVITMKISQRNCLFRHEKSLQLFSNYTFENCLTECRIKILQKLCGCIPVFYKSNWANWTPPIRVCNLRDIRCLSEKKHRYMSSIPGYDVYQTMNAKHAWGEENSECDCYPDCDSASYGIHSSRGMLSQQHSVYFDKYYGNTQHKSMVSIFFKDLTASKMRRDITISWTEMLCLFGGIFSLCLGFTFVSLFDVIYTFTIKLVIDWYLQKKSQTKIRDKVVSKHTMDPNTKDLPVYFVKTSPNINKLDYIN